MSTKTIAGVEVNLNDEGYMEDASQWTKEIGAEIAKEEGIELTEKHYELIEWIRNKVAAGEGLTIRGIGKSGVVNAKEFYGLFPGAPLKKATKIAGVPKPTSCI
ncbi:MAG: TusE/DsrC/DsvC family sulfur relay protein [Lentimicrobiaceae bacterium]|jgi:tRNA 2-thiouridine synthesizing protein E|nr:TusE/DsrC/DsvC family sulfur relay protein [Lentimicrobiaceae bacterium]MCP4910631.1 TusE/DsrC/DsvC family sulfur relay protein [Bacteroidota bacterium]MBT3454864.1 TusE/DsrC/DsvC family sulfur relay protein [Lentimicrobiaceae bacterium]MBT3818510.1 TusE/DsrC/DsvC family sulfur relay protein [Lentimicrobiaceae bacterium]MBT4060877.1 TusE/DsrC/DsvC family sulfur relay protein [Lentimicrobiaceae bacterium]